ncbi:MAG TPA: UDP binding domain-containing protein, partial [Acidimicrobiales bacterium]|nr:UDP binding domain-containing protein [Acidimicrobiales bacterium]
FRGLDLRLFDDPYECCEGASALVVLTEWPEFAGYDLARAGSVMAKPGLVDTRNIFHPGHARDAGLGYTGMGRS